MSNNSNRNKSADECDSPADFDFRHHLFDTIILLGGKKEIADLVKKSLDFGVTPADILCLRNYNIELLEQTKRRLLNINTVQVAASPS